MLRPIPRFRHREFQQRLPLCIRLAKGHDHAAPAIDRAPPRLSLHGPSIALAIDFDDTGKVARVQHRARILIDQGDDRNSLDSGHRYVQLKAGRF